MSSTDSSRPVAGEVVRYSAGTPRPSKRRPYQRPRVIDQGRLVEIALGGTPGTGDSGPGGAFQNPPET